MKNRVADRWLRASPRLQRDEMYEVMRRGVKLSADGATSFGGWSGSLKLEEGDLLRFIGWKAGDWGPDEPIFEYLPTSKEKEKWAGKRGTLNPKVLAHYPS